MPIQLYDSLERKLKPLVLSQSDGVFRFYNCGLTVYAAGHIGNFRTFVVNDVLRRLLELEFPGKVKHVRNLTDVDDKTIKRAQDEKRPLAEITKQWTDKFHADCITLNCLPPHEEPRAADPKYLREQVNMIDVLMEKGNAYRTADGSVFFKVSSFEEYGALSRVKERELKLGVSQKNTAFDDEKDDLTDFALWKAWRPDDGLNKWPGPRGASEGRPGWHIECSAMSKALLGPTIDLHTGGVDLLFPHHENEIAQSECCNGTLFAHHWYHSEHLLVDGKKMSKSLGNYYTVGDITAKGFSPMALRYALLAAHPRKQLNFTLESLHAAGSALKSINDIAARLAWAASGLDDFERGVAFGQDFLSKRPEVTDGFDVYQAAWDALCDDVNLPRASAVIFEQSPRQSLVNPQGKPDKNTAMARLVGLRKILWAWGLITVSAPKIDAPAAVTALADKRWAARTAKDWAGADALRKELTAAGWSMLDGKDGYKLEPLKK